MLVGKPHHAMFRRKPCESVEVALADPQAVRFLRLIDPGVVSFGEFATLLPKLTGVREICLGWQRWTQLPQELAGFGELRSFTVLNMPIQTFPAFLASCPRLTELVLRGTEIISIPASVQAFVRLHRLDFSNNPVREIPPELGHLSELREIQLADLGLRSLPESISKLRRVRSFALAGNCFSGAEASRIRGWFRRGVVSVWSSDEVAA